jgi:hypothetical protein
VGQRGAEAMAEIRRMWLRSRSTYAVLAIWGALAACGQLKGTGQASVAAGSAPASEAQPVSLSAMTVLSEREDPSTGDRWLLVPNPIHPEGPTRWVRVQSLASDKQGHPTGAGRGNGLTRNAAHPMVIHSGDKVIVEEHSAVVDARLEAVALGAAARGGELRVRLEVGGQVVPVVALEPGRVLLAPKSESAR